MLCTKNKINKYIKDLKVNIHFSLAIRDEKIITFKKAYIKFTKKWVGHCRDKIQEFEEIKSLRLAKLFGFEHSEIQISKLMANDATTFDIKLRQLADYLSYININMNSANLKLIKNIEDVLDNEIKAFSDLVAPIFSNMREVEFKYSKKLSRNVKSVLGNPNLVVPERFMQHFKNK